MVLIDTNVIIDIWKNIDNEAIKVFEKEEIAEKLSYLNEYNIKENQWTEFGEFLHKLRTSGVTLPYPDALIAFIAIKNNLQILTRDKHFKLIQVVEPSLKLYK